ncbi:DUF6531 domain-containing protein [Nocardioides sp. AX2bis]|uniref:DUF6531 domain-containing protein n=1 Tax=Nocardioides sp. AX2bis TaxID=2653157 RepID=UPI0012F402FA|nr:DUF6531 domain-containing protein [Nocardioides sp. AX2bis]VXC55649.1 RHS repeat-associated core domain-containing protein [Nocardioides sp. AX2bis]
MGDPLSGIDDDVKFGWSEADALTASANAAASLIESQAGGRAFWVTHAMVEFRGFFSVLFQTNASTARSDGDELAQRLRDIALASASLKEKAQAEQDRREAARAWVKERKDRNAAEKVWDAITPGSEDPPPPGPEPELHRPVSTPPPGGRQTPTPGTGGGAGGTTSSARPADLDSFAAQSGDRNVAQRTSLYTVRSDYNAFVGKCEWGSLEATEVLNAFSSWLELNDNDVDWASAVAQAFAAAGSEGDVVTLSNSALSAALRSAGVSATRQDLTIPAPGIIGEAPTSGYADDPVNTATGNFLETETDLAFAGGCSTLVLRRTYNALGTTTGAFGPGWSSWTESHVRFDDESAALVLPDGREVLFPRLGDAWDRATGESLWLDRDGDGYVVRSNDGTRWELGRDGALRSLRHPSGARVHLEHVESRLVRLRHDRGRAVDLVWSGDRIVEARASDGRTVSYTYDDQRRLVAATGVLGTRSYGWDDQGRVATVTSEAGVVEVDNTYDARGRVASQRSPFGRTSRYAYLPGRVTVVSDEDGTRSNTWVSDRRGRLVGAVDAHEHRQSFSYDAWGNRVLVTERDGSTTVSEHDERGRLIRRVLPSGADLRWAFDDDDRVTAVVTDDATTRLDYEGDDRSPSLLVDAEGGETRMTWRAGLMTHLVDPTGVEVAFTHDAHGDLVAITAADGGTARLERDGAGRVVAAIDPLGHRTGYTYDERGLLKERCDADGAVRRFEHDDAGRLVAQVDATGARSEVERGHHGQIERLVDPLGRATERSYDDLGNLSTVVLPDGATWRFLHDALSRLVETTDPTGATWGRHHDEVGMLTRVDDPTGVAQHAHLDRASGEVTAHDAGSTAGLRLDRLGRVESTTEPDGSTTLTRYDRCGRVVERVDQTGAVTRMVRDAGGRVVELVSASGGRRRFEHDRCGRLVAVVGEDGGRTVLERDLAGRVVVQVLADGTRIEVDYDAMGRVVRRRVPGHGTTRVERDAAGRVRSVHDPRFGRRTFVRDAADRVVEAVDARGGTTRYAHDDADRVVSAIDPLGGRSTYAYDEAGRLVERTDPLGRQVRFTYDAAGRPVERTDPTGGRVGWTYDAAGLPDSFQVGERTSSRTERDHRGRRTRIVEHGPGREHVHELAWDPRGLLVERSRDGLSVRWDRDAEGRVAAITAPDGSTTRYERDAAGRVVDVQHPVLGRVVLKRDPAGRVTSAEADGTSHRWERGAGGQVAAHETRHADGAVRRTEVVRDDDGRVVGIVRDGDRTRYEHDAAGQLVAAGDGAISRRWRYDAAGRLVTEDLANGGTVERVYDAAGQLVSSRTGGSVTAYTYDGAGRRLQRRTSDGSLDEYVWEAGGMASLTRTAADGTTERTSLRVDALGELAEVDGVPVFWDSARLAGGPVQVGAAVVVDAGPLTGVGGASPHGWSSPGWREARSGTDPWQPSSAAQVTHGVSVGAAGELVVAGLEWLGARVYDQDTRAFLTPDPVEPVAGAAWAGNPYSYAGNDPLHALDPLGLSPMTDADLAAWSEANKGWGEHVADWTADNWEYLAGGAMVLAGGVMIATGVGGPAGMALIAAGADTIIQKATTGEVNWKQVAVSGLIGGATAGFGTYVTAPMKAAVQTGAMSTTKALTINVAGNAAIGGVGNTASYLVSGEDVTWNGTTGAFLGGTLSGGANGLSGPLGDRAASWLGTTHRSGLSGVVAREAPSGLIDGAGGFAGSATQDLLTSGEVDFDKAAFKGAGASTAGGFGRAGSDLLPPDLSTGGRRALPTPGRPWLAGLGGEGADTPVTAMADRYADDRFEP